MWISLLWGAVLTLFSILLLRPVAERLKLMDHPSEQRKSHLKPTPVLGVSLVIGTLSAWWLWQDDFSIAMGLGALGMFLIGVDDDRQGRPALFKLIGQFMVACLVVVISGLKFDAVSVGDWQISLGIMAMPWTVLWLVTITNALNLIDGSDGLAVGITAIIAAGIGVVSGITWTWVLVGAGFIFWFFNKPPAKTFLGDGGAYFAGFFLGMLSLGYLTSSWGGDFSLMGVTLLFLVPVADLGFSILRRLFKKQSVIGADHDHIHHRLERRFGPWGMLVILYGVTVLSVGLWGLGWWR